MNWGPAVGMLVMVIGAAVLYVVFASPPARVRGLDKNGYPRYGQYGVRHYRGRHPRRRHMHVAAMPRSWW